MLTQVRRIRALAMIERRTEVTAVKVTMLFAGWAVIGLQYRVL